MQDKIETELTFEQKKWLHDAVRQDARRAHDRFLIFAYKVNKCAIARRQPCAQDADGDQRWRGRIAIDLYRNASAEISALRQHAPCCGSLFEVAAGAVGFMFAYLTNYFTGKAAMTMAQIWEHPYVLGTKASRCYSVAKFTSHIVVVLACAISFSLFVEGIWIISDALQHLPQG